MLVFGAPAKPDRVWDASNAQKAVRQLYDEMADALGIPLLREVSSHVWRAPNNTIMRDKGVLPEVRAALFGHSEETTTRPTTPPGSTSPSSPRRAQRRCPAHSNPHNTRARPVHQTGLASRVASVFIRYRPLHILLLLPVYS